MASIGWECIYDNTLGTSSGDVVHIFLLADSGTNFTVTGSGNVEVLVVGGGGGGGSCAGGGGGAGEYEYNASLAVTAQAYEVTVGAGGATADGTYTAGYNGGTSQFSTIVGLGGGGGGGIAEVPHEGASGGGGAGHTSSNTGANGTNGNAGGNGNYTGDHRVGAGGGGSSAVGQNATGPTTYLCGNGGAGTSNTILDGSTDYYAAGGGGSTNEATTDATPGVGGSSIGGNGGSTTTAATAAVANTGSGGGGGVGGATGGNGSSGIVIIRYKANSGISATGGTITYPACTSITLSNLTGNTDKEYKLEARVVSGAANSNYFVRVNNDSTAGIYGNQILTGNNTTTAAARDTSETYLWLTNTADNDSGDIVQANMLLYAKSGFVRTAIVESTENISTTTVTQVSLYGESYNETATEITSLVVLSDVASGLGVGTNIRLWRKASLQINADYTATALALTTALQGVTYRSDGTVSPSALTLALSLKEVICGHSIVVEGGALTLALWNPSIRIDSTVSPSAQTLTLALPDPVIRGDANVYPIAQALTLALQNPTYRGDSTFTTTALELIATLNDPTVVWSSSVSPSALTLSTTLHGGVPFVITRILRRGYTFGAVEQVTHTKLNNIPDTAIWEISNQVAGDMFTYDATQPEGSRWVRIPKGTAGQKLTMGATYPTWA